MSATFWLAAVLLYVSNIGIFAASSASNGVKSIGLDGEPRRPQLFFQLRVDPRNDHCRAPALLRLSRRARRGKRRPEAKRMPQRSRAHLERCRR